MFAYLTKKIVLPNQGNIQCLSWSYKYGSIACGCESGLLKLIKLDLNYNLDVKCFNSNLNSDENENEEQKFTEKNFLTLNQTLEGHKNKINHLIFNENYDKLCSSDENGLIIVWEFHDDNWYEKMINNRNKNNVIDMKWSKNGSSICIVHNDNLIIVGSVEGNRLWSKEIKSIKITCLEWSPNDKKILFGSNDGQIHCYDNNGNYLSKMIISIRNTKNLINATNPNQVSIISIKWFKNSTSFNSRYLIIALSSGELHFYLDEFDDNAFAINTELKTIKFLEWNIFGNMIAVGGEQEIELNDKTVKKNIIKFYTPNGKMIFIFKIPGKNLTCCSWEKTDLRMTIGIDDCIYFAHIRPNYIWAYFMNTFVFAIPNQEDYNLVMFYQMKTNHLIKKKISNLIDICAKNQYCTLATYIVDSNRNKIKQNRLNEENNQENKCTLYLSNSIGTSVDTVNLELNLTCLTMNTSRVIAASNESFYIWKFKTHLNEIKYENNNNNNKESIDIKESNLDEEDLGDCDRLFNIYLSRTEKITCIDCSEKLLIVGQVTCNYYVYDLPRANFILKLNLVNLIPKKIQLNFNSSKLAIIDLKNSFKIINLNQTSNNIVYELDEIWDFKWSEDTTTEFIYIKNAKLFIQDLNQIEFNNISVSSTSGYICETKDLTINVLHLDKLIEDFLETNLKCFNYDDYLQIIESKLLTEAKKLFQNHDLNKITKFIELNPHPKLWILLTKYALDVMNLDVAELGAINSNDFKCIQFIKKLRKLTDSNLIKAEINLFYNKLDEAEKIYQNLDRIDLILNMYQLFGNWEKLLNLNKKQPLLDQNELNLVYEGLANLNKENQNYFQAIEYFKLNQNYNQLIECYLILEEFDEIKNLFENNLELNNDINLGNLFESIGLCDQAIKIYLNCDQQQKAIDCAIKFNEWECAIELTQKFSSFNIDSLLETYVQHLISEGNHFAIIELYRKTKQYLKGINYFFNLIQKHSFKSSNLIVQKKIYTIIGLLFEEKNELLDKTIHKENKLNQLLIEDFIEDKSDQNSYSKQCLRLFLDQPWIGAEAFHFYFLAQKQLKQGYIDAAMKTSLHLVDYEKFIEPIQIYSLIALCSALNRNFSVCSKAFIKLESLQETKKSKLSTKYLNKNFYSNENLYKDYAMKIFIKYSPKDIKDSLKMECPYCESLIEDYNKICPSCETKFNVCIASGRQILQLNQQWTCFKCKHHANKSDLLNYHNCPLCHTPIKI